MAGIRDRIDAALEKMRWEKVEVRAICLNAADLKALGEAQRIASGFPKRHIFHCHGYRDHIVRPAKHSRIYSTHGREFAIPKKLSHKVTCKEALA